MNPAIEKRKEMVKTLELFITDVIAFPDVAEQFEEIRDHLAGVCVWSENDEGVWSNVCPIHDPMFLERSPVENGILYCERCGKPIEEKPYTQEPKEGG